jgi:hypothetical protein
MGGHVLYDDCIVHISTEDLIYNSNVVSDRLLVFLDNTDLSISTEVAAKYTDISIDDNIKVLLRETAKQAAYNSTTRYATGRMDVNSTLPLFYSQAQCNLDLLPKHCWDCLDNIRWAAKSFFYQRRSEWIAGVWCNFRYSTYQFYEGQPTQQITWLTSVDPTPNMTAPTLAPGPVGVPKQKDKNKPVAVSSQNHKSKQINMFFLSTKLGCYCCCKEHFHYIYIYVCLLILFLQYISLLH